MSTPVCSLKGDLASASTEHRVAEQEWLTKLQTAEATCQSCKAAVMPDMRVDSRWVLVNLSAAWCTRPLATSNDLAKFLEDELIAAASRCCSAF